MLAQSTVDIGAVQTLRKAVLLVAVMAVVTLFAFSASQWSGSLNEAIEAVGLCLILLCIGGRTWCSLYIGGRKTTELVMVGPYSVCRNPLYVFSILGAAGVGAQLGAVSTAVAAGAFTWLVFTLVARQEERVLLAGHGDAYRAYFGSVPRFLPRLRLWRNANRLDIHRRAVVTTFLDACFFLAAVPLAEGLDYLHGTGALRVFLTLP